MPQHFIITIFTTIFIAIYVCLNWAKISFAVKKRSFAQYGYGHSYKIRDWVDQSSIQFNIINIVKMNDNHYLFSNQQQLDFLLDISHISEEYKQAVLTDFTMSVDKLNMSQKERTREESYEDIMKQIHTKKIQRIQLAKQLQQLKKEIYQSYLRPFEEEFKELNQQNIILRKELNKFHISRQDKIERYSNRSPIKPKTSIKSHYGDQNKKTNTKAKNRVSPNLLIKKEIKFTESTSNLGRSQIQSPRYHKKRESQLTERKIQQNNWMGTSVNISVDEKVDEFQIKQSISKQHLRGESAQQKNIFVEILQKILHQEKEYDCQRYGELQHYSSIKIDKEVTNQVVFVNQLEAEIKKTNEKLQMLSLIVTKYQKEMEHLNINLKNVEEWTLKLWEVKGKYMQMQTKCSQLGPLRRQVSQKQSLLYKLKLASTSQQEKSISSIESMIKLLSNPSKVFNQKGKLYMTYYRQIKQLFKFDKEQQNKRYSKIMKVKETIDSIRQGRKKFNELIQIYQGRIGKLEEKISKVRQHNQRR